MTLTVADLIVGELRRAGVPRLFGVPGGGSSLDLLEAARLQGLPFVLCHHEWAGCIMAAVTGELTGRPGAAVSALGPGVTASATGLAHAFLDRSPMIFLSDRHPESALAFTTHQRVDHAGLVAGIVKATMRIEADSAGQTLAHAVELALREPRGPVHLDLAADVARQPVQPSARQSATPGAGQAATSGVEQLAAGASDATPSPGPAPDAAALDRAAAMIGAATRPVVLAGHQCRGADSTWLRAFCEALPAPCLTTYKAKGAIPDPHPLALGVFTGGALEEAAVGRADLIIAFGLDPVELIPRRWSYTAPVLSISRCPSDDLRTTAGAYFVPAHEVVGDLGSIIEELAPRTVGRTKVDWDVVEVDRLKRERERSLEVPVPGLAPHRVVQMARELTPAGTIATVDAGAHMFPATAYWHAVEPGELLISNGLATMGFALPAAIAAQLVHPERRVVCFSGDGGLMMAAAELETVARLRLPLLIIVFNDAALSLIQIKQDQMGYGGTPLRYAGPDLAALARSFGLETFVASDERALGSALFSALARTGPTFIDARIDPSGYRAMLEIVRGTPTR